MIKLNRISTQEEFDKGVEALTSIFIEEYPYYSTWISNHLEQFKSGEKQILSINNENELLGYLMLHFCTDKIVKINGIYVFENNKGKGIATMAISELTKLLQKMNVQLIFVQTRLDNNAVVHLFDKTGYNLIGKNFHPVELKDNWVACNNVSSLELDEQKVALEIYDGFTPLSEQEVQELRNKHKDGNLVLKKKIKKIGD
ncbi:MAG: GNAT family N-acetyltransferase [Bacilli bacterium]|nr:GNAT family N-acetyltransferase [Bacilli bacterium]MDY5996781.1 GNAT family N-acetyltransferase [Bacilli bacterium]